MWHLLNWILFHFGFESYVGNNLSIIDELRFCFCFFFVFFSCVATFVGPIELMDLQRASFLLCQNISETFSDIIRIQFLIQLCVGFSARYLPLSLFLSLAELHRHPNADYKHYCHLYGCSGGIISYEHILCIVVIVVIFVSLTLSHF